MALRSSPLHEAAERLAVILSHDRNDEFNNLMQQMKYYRLHIDSKNSFEIYSKITEILGVKPTEFESKNNLTDLYSLLTYSIDEKDETPYYDFINNFLDIIEPKFAE